MKKLVFLSIVALLITLASCRDCPPCPKDMEVPECFEKLITYQVGDTIRFRNSLNDTMVFVCEERSLRQNAEVLDGSETEGCCPSYMVAQLVTTLESSSGKLEVGTTNHSPIICDIELNLNNDTKHAYVFNCLSSYALGSISLANVTFNDVIGSKLDTANDSVFIQQIFGIIGFKVDGVEWAKID